ncbi:MAG: methyltransferase domain-containing protein, partial [Paracoccaceae bacterium]
MQTPPILTDLVALARNRARATDPFLQAEALTDVQERLSEVNKAFTSTAVVTAFPELWRPGFADARVVPDAEVLDLAPQSQDLLVHGLGLHWANDPVGQLVQCRRALRPDGLLLALMFGGQTLH